MGRSYAIIDLFAGPGGLGEGFSRAGLDTATPMDIRVSVEMEDHAIATLRLRSFLRSFDGTFPREYYDALNAGRDLPCWDELHPANWRRACDEARQLVLGQEGVFEELATILDQARDGMHGDTILIGGPPCQAYSLAGRSRNLGKAGYVLEEDGRHYLYREYVRILTLRPAYFVPFGLRHPAVMRKGKGLRNHRPVRQWEQLFVVDLGRLVGGGEGINR